MKLGRVINPELGKRGELVLSVVLNGLGRGYTLSNVLNLVRQSNNETANGYDYKFQTHSNAFGMRLPSWSTRAIGSVGIEGQAIYRNVNDAVLDRLDWDKRNGLNGREREYLTQVQIKGYNPSPLYPSIVEGFSDLRGSVIRCVVALPVAAYLFVYLTKSFF